MKVVIAKQAGFCMGVRRAVDLTLDLVNKGEQNISTFGPLIHNPQVLEVLQDKGVGILSQIPADACGTVIIRAHGVPPSHKEQLKKSGLVVKDATCPRVLKVQAIINKHRKLGKTTVIIGDRNHAEVDGLMGYAGPDCQVVSNEAEADELTLTRPYIIVCQTTQDERVFDKFTSIITSHYPGGEVFNTICDSTHRRQEEVRKLCEQVEAVVVVGGKTSANTTRLAEIAAGLGRRVFLIESEQELEEAGLRDFDCVGVTAGASTPTWMINRVVRALEAIPGRSDNRCANLLFRFVRLSMVSNLYVSVSGGILAYACSLLQGLPPRLSQGVVAFCYLFAMHNINRLTDQQSKIFDDPVYLQFSYKYRKTMMALATFLLFCGLGLATLDGWQSLLALLVMSVFGVLYRIQFIPEILATKIRVSRLKEIPASKTFFVALAWALVLVLLPALQGAAVTAKTWGLMLFMLLLVFVRNALFDVFQVQGDRIMGRETLPVLIGADKTIVVLQSVMAILLTLLLVVYPFFGLIVMPRGYWLLPGLLYLVGFTYLYSKGYWSPGVKLEFGLETTFIIIAASVWGGAALCCA